MNDRARLTLPDVAFFTMSLAVLAALAPVLYDSLEAKGDVLGTGVAYIMQMVVPLAVLVLLYVMWITARAGVRQ